MKIIITTFLEIPSFENIEKVYVDCITSPTGKFPSGGASREGNTQLWLLLVILQFISCILSIVSLPEFITCAEDAFATYLFDVKETDAVKTSFGRWSQSAG